MSVSIAASIRPFAFTLFTRIISVALYLRLEHKRFGLRHAGVGLGCHGLLVRSDRKVSSLHVLGWETRRPCRFWIFIVESQLGVEYSFLSGIRMLLEGINSKLSIIATRLIGK
jgi:hypothetical protein